MYVAGIGTVPFLVAPGPGGGVEGLEAVDIESGGHTGKGLAEYEPLITDHGDRDLIGSQLSPSALIPH